ncbi:hypothetical protein DFH06DRAFT_711411 [Mycena polygramma]|nr:hypothetical protein DFH06DRAFT_711411 [Mycena polygramma]
MRVHAPQLTIISLPNEVLVAIAAAGQEGPVNPATFTGRPEWALSRVSRHFRDVVVNSPELWTSVDVNLDAEGSVEILKLYLQRSRARSISAAIHYLPKTTHFLDNAVLNRLRLVALHIHRVWRLEIAICTVWSEHLLGPLREIAAPNLRYLEISNHLKKNDFVRKPVRGPVDIFSFGAPRLAVLKMSGFTYKSRVPRWTAALTHLELWNSTDYNASVGKSVFVEITTRCLALVHLSLDVSGMSHIERHRLHLPSLEYLRISISQKENEHYLLTVVGLFDTPVLTEFIIEGTHGDQIAALFNSTGLSHSPFPALTSLAFVNTPEPSSCDNRRASQVILSLPRLFPALHSLSLINQCFTANLVKDLLGPASVPETVTLGLKDTIEHVSDALREAVRLRRRYGQSLPRLRLSSALVTSLLPAAGLEELVVEVFDDTDILCVFRTPQSTRVDTPPP